jgi:hypothetical protein
MGDAARRDNAKSTVTCLDPASANSAGAFSNRALDCSDEEGATMSTILAAARVFGLSMRTSTLSHPLIRDRAFCRAWHKARSLAALQSFNRSRIWNSFIARKANFVLSFGSSREICYVLFGNVTKLNQAPADVRAGRFEGAAIFVP